MLNPATSPLLTDREHDLKRVLFVDDDASVLEGLRDALRPYRSRWQMAFVASGEEALKVLADTKHEVVISDLRMPSMDGATLLEAVGYRHPEAVRIVLSGHADMTMIARAAAVAHRLIAKPCATRDLVEVIEQACSLQSVASMVDRRALGTSSLPAVPRLYVELTEMLQSGTAGAADAARIVESDVAMTAKILQLANSSYFGRSRPVSTVSEAIAYLGLEPLRALVLSASAFQRFSDTASIDGLTVESLQLHCVRVAQLATAVMAEHSRDTHVFTAGLLHDVGLLVLASQQPDELAADLARARAEHRPLYEIEGETRGLTHAGIGAQLLALWGLPPHVCLAVATHHDSRSLTPIFDAPAAVYVANALIEELEAHSTPDRPPPVGLDLDYLERAGLSDRLERWRALAAQRFEETPRLG